jgi:hypothetical protein
MNETHYDYCPHCHSEHRVTHTSRHEHGVTECLDCHHEERQHLGSIKHIPACKVFAGQYVIPFGTVTFVAWGRYGVRFSFDSSSDAYYWDGDMVPVDMARSPECPHIS